MPTNPPPTPNTDGAVTQEDRECLARFCGTLSIQLSAYLSGKLLEFLPVHRLAAYQRGAEDMRERAARAAEGKRYMQCGPYTAEVCDAVAAEIRNLTPGETAA